MAATFDIEIVTRTTEFRVRPGDKVALPCEVRTSGESMSSHYQMTILAKMPLKWGARILQSIRLDLDPVAQAQDREMIISKIRNIKKEADH